MRLSSYRKARPDTPRFEAIRETRVPVPGRPVRRMETLACASVTCRRGGDPTAVSDCFTCSHFVNFRPDPVEAAVTLRCLFCDDDPVRDIMSLPSSFVTVEPLTTITEADEVARKNDVRHLLVTLGDELVGVVCRCDFLPPKDGSITVGEVMGDLPLGIRSTTSLGEAVAVMRERRVGLLLVVEDSEVVGVLTRGDLRRAGVPEPLLGADVCDACGSTHGVIDHPDMAGVLICIDCFERAMDAVEQEELGGGD